MQRGYRQTSIEQRAFPLAAGDRPGIKSIWHEHAKGIVAKLENTGLASFEMARARLAATLWPETLRLFSDIAERLIISDKTVKSHVSNILNKLHLADRTQAAVFAWREGVVRRGEE